MKTRYKRVIGASALAAVVGLQMWSTTSAVHTLSDRDSQLSGFDEKSYARSILNKAGGNDVRIKFSADPDKNCAVAEGFKQGGCYSLDDPDSITVSPGMDEDELHYVVLHEFAHYIQHHDVVTPPTMDVDIECDADQRAYIMGAPSAQLYYANSPEYNYCGDYFREG